MVARVFLCLGQSNMGGQFSGTVPAHLQASDSGIKIWTGASWDTLVNKTNNQTLSGGGGYWGPEAEFAYQFRQSFPSETIYLLKYAVGSTAATYFLSGGAGYDAVTAALPTALAAIGSSYNVEGLLWYQGEQDSTSQALADAYQSNMEALAVVVKTTWSGNEATRFLITQVNPGDGRTYLSTVRSAQAAFCAADAATRKLNDAAAYSYQGDTVHLDATGYVDCGAEMFSNYLLGRRSRMVWG